MNGIELLLPKYIHDLYCLRRDLHATPQLSRLEFHRAYADTDWLAAGHAKLGGQN
jgi:hypothetical protein